MRYWLDQSWKEPCWHCQNIVRHWLFLLLFRITLAKFEEANFNLMIDIMRKSAQQGQTKQSGKGKRAPKQLKYPSSVQPFMKLMGLNLQEMRSALQQAMTGGAGGGLMT